MPVRTFGHFTRATDGVIRFEYRPWLVFAARVIELPSGFVAIFKGAFFPALLHSIDGITFITLITFPPRYRGKETVIGAHCEIHDIRDGAIIRGFRAVRAWLADNIDLSKAKYVEVRAKQIL